jgi:hypothetical protein
MSDRRRVNGPAGGTAAPTFTQLGEGRTAGQPGRTRNPNELRKICVSLFRHGTIPC